VVRSTRVPTAHRWQDAHDHGVEMSKSEWEELGRSPKAGRTVGDQGARPAIRENEAVEIVLDFFRAFWSRAPAALISYKLRSQLRRLRWGLSEGETGGGTVSRARSCGRTGGGGMLGYCLWRLRCCTSVRAGSDDSSIDPAR
jgi:hypothetical protein